MPDEPESPWPAGAAPDTTTDGGMDAPDDASDPRTVATNAASKDTRELECVIVECASTWARSQYRLIGALAAYDSSGAWALSGARTCAHWLADRIGVAVGTAREWLRVGHALEKLPMIDAALGEGRLSYCGVRTLTRVAVDHPEHEAELLELAERAAPRDLSRQLAKWTLEHDTDEQRRRRERRHTYLSTRVGPDGMGWLHAALPAIDLGRIQAAVDGRAMRVDHCDPDDDHPGLGYRRARALVELVESRASGDTEGSATEIVLHVRADGATMHDGTPVAESTVASLIDSAFIRALIHDAEGRPVNASVRRRHPTVRQKRVVEARDRCCVDCGGTEFLEFDHDPDYSTSRRTHTDELFLRCGTCHRRRHGDEPPEADAATGS